MKHPTIPILSNHLPETCESLPDGFKGRFLHTCYTNATVQCNVAASARQNKEINPECQESLINQRDQYQTCTQTSLILRAFSNTCGELFTPSLGIHKVQTIAFIQPKDVTAASASQARPSTWMKPGLLGCKNFFTRIHTVRHGAIANSWQKTDRVMILSKRM